MRKLWPVLIIAALAAALFLLVGRPGEEWTAGSKEAIQEFEAGIEARLKLYHREAREHFERAVELDPDFAVAQVALLESTREREAREELVAHLRSLDLAGLSRREAFMVEHALARVDGDDVLAEELLEGFLAANPKDPYALAACSNTAWEKQDFKRAERHYRRLLEVDPNWVVAQNRLGYLAMAQGRFEEAEQLFQTYKYIAPDQANPHDSLGELLTLVGRYDGAREQLEQALAIKPDFCPSYEHLRDLAILEGRMDEAMAAVDRAAEVCEERHVATMRCSVLFWGDLFTGDLEAPWTDERNECLELLGEGNFLVHRLALLSGRDERVLAAEAQIREAAERKQKRGWAYGDYLQGLLFHMEGLRAAAEGDLDGAVRNLRGADELLVYWGEGQGILKLFNQINLAWALALAGDEPAAERTLDRVRDVNPSFAEVYSEFEVFFPRSTPVDSGVEAQEDSI